MKFQMIFLTILCTPFISLRAEKSIIMEPVFLTRAEFARLTPQEMAAIVGAGGAIMVEEPADREREQPRPAAVVAVEEPSGAEVQALIEQFGGVFGDDGMSLT